MRFNKNLFFLVIIFIIVVAALNYWGYKGKTKKVISYSAFSQALSSGTIAKITLDQDDMYGTFKSGKEFRVYYNKNIQDNTLIPRLESEGVNFEFLAPSRGLGTFFAILINWFPMILLIGLWFFFMRQMQGAASGRGGIMGFGKSRAKLVPKQEGVRFIDVAGIDNVKKELSEVVDFLKFPGRYQRMGAKIPKGVLLVGSPGTGKTLLAKAVSGEASVPFFSISGSDFVEMFVGVGASRVRDMFTEARKHAPCIIFVDELDAVGRHRGAGLGGGNDEREQTLNQILVEMDGMDPIGSVIIIAATNRPDVLDPALLRPGRFDRQIVVPLPDFNGREAILKVHSRPIRLAPDVDLGLIAQSTPGFSGAELANLCNESTLIAVRNNRRVVDAKDFDQARDKLMMGLERPLNALTKEEIKLTAYHESGHAVATLYSPASDPIYKATIVPRGRALGMVMRLPKRDQYSMPYDKLIANLVVGMGGRVAEELIFGKEKITTGASSDITAVTDIARKMVTEWGFSKKLGNVRYNENQEEVFLGHSVQKTQNISEKTMEIIDSEVKRIVDEAEKKCREILTIYSKALDFVAKALIKYETLSGDELKKIADGKRIRTKISKSKAAQAQLAILGSSFTE